MERIKEYLNYFIDANAFNSDVYMRVIVDYDIPFPSKSYEGIEFSKIKAEEHNGWGTPNKIFRDVELFYLNNKFKILSFEEWKNCESVNHPFYSLKK